MLALAENALRDCRRRGSRVRCSACVDADSHGPGGRLGRRYRSRRAERRAGARGRRARIRPPGPRSLERATVSVRPEALGAGLSVDTAVGAALAATPHSRIALPVRSSQAKIAAVVASLAKRYDRPAIDATVDRRDDRAGRVSQPPRPGLAVDAKTMRTALAQVLQRRDACATHAADARRLRPSARRRRSAR